MWLGANTRAYSGASQLADWLLRSSGSGVVWSHNFDSPLEVDKFRWRSGTGSDPANTDGVVNWDSEGFAGGGSVRLDISTNGNSDGKVWWRPMSALAAGGNGKAVNDPAANGTLSVRTWNPVQDTDPGFSFTQGYYGNAAVQAAVGSTWDGHSNVWDGTDFYFQVRVKIPASRWAGGNWNPFGSLSGATQGANPQGKLLYLDIMGRTGTQEVLVRSNSRLAAYTGSTGEFDIYTSEGNYQQSYLGNPQGSTDGTTVGQPGGPFGSACILSSPNTPGGGGTCWLWPADTWVTLLFHITPGNDNSGITGLDFGDSSTWHLGHQDHGIEVWYALPGDTSYTLLWSKLDYLWQYGSGTPPLHPPAFNGLSASIYMNGATAFQGWWHKYTQMIFSKSFIPCPQPA